MISSEVMRRWRAPARRPLLLQGAFVLLFNGSLLLWLLVKPGPQSLFTAVDNVAQIVGPLVMLLAFARMLAGARLPKDRLHRASIFLALGVLTDTLGQAIWTYYAQVLHRATPFPSWADASYLSTYPLLLAGILMMPGRRISLAVRARVALDGIMVMTAAITVSWYFVLGPTILQGGESAFAKVVGTAYPLGDLLLIACLMVLAVQVRDRAARPVIAALFIGLTSIIAADSIFDNQTLYGTYATGELIDVGWPLGDMLICLAAGLLWHIARRERPEERSVEVEQKAKTRVWHTLVPYALVPAIGLLLVYVRRVHGDDALEPGVNLGAAVLIGLVLLRQILAILENARLSDELQTNNDALREANRRLEEMATTDPLTGLPNHRALIQSLDQELERARRYNRPCSLLFFDLDHFKTVNDGLGHPVGDAVLKELGAVARNSLRSIDTLGRWGGEEFVIILTEAGRQEALAVAERLRETVASHHFFACQGVRLTCSLGLATYPYDAAGRDGLVEMADRAMYGAKRLGRNQVRGIDDPAVEAVTNESSAATSREETALRGTVEALAALVDARDHYTGRHVHEVAGLGMRLALALGLDANEAHLIGLAARLHDVGKVGVPDTVLNKPGSLTAEEWALIRMHPVVGADVVGRVPALRVIAPIVRAHHERWDGNGYPDGLRGKDIPIGARVLSVADAYHAMTSDRPYRLGTSSRRAMDELVRCAGAQFDPAVVEALQHVLAVEEPPAPRREAV